MQLDIIGHASLLIRTVDRTILMDPVLFDPHQEGLFDVFPKRYVSVADMPHHDVLVISHKHLDHFDIRSLSALPRRTPVLIPKDALLERYLQRLGFSQVRTLGDFAEVRMGGTTLFTTRSENPVPEFGVVISDSTGSVWNQVDTIVATRTVHAVKQRSNVDLVIASWQPMMETNYTSNKPTAFPVERYGDILYHLNLLEPRAVLPGANAFCYTGASAWMNHVVFPQTRERFLHDVKDLLGDRVACLAGDPGDVVTVTQSGTEIAQKASHFVTRTDTSRDLLSFSPASVDSELRDENPLGIQEEELRRVVQRTLGSDLPQVLLDKREQFTQHALWRVIHAITVVFPSDKRSWTVDFTSAPPTVTETWSPCANVLAMISASALHGLATKQLGWDYALLGGHYRCVRRLYTVAPTGLVSGHLAVLPDPLEVLFPYHELLTSILDTECTKWAHESVSASTSTPVSA